MEHKNIFEKVKGILVDQLDVEEAKVTMEASVMEDLGADSLDVVDIVKTLDEEFGVHVPDADIEKLKTVGDIVRYLGEKE